MDCYWKIVLPSAVSSYYVKNRSYATVNLELAYDAATDSIKAYANGVEKSFGDNLPVGTIMPFIGNIYAIPSKWRLCDGNNGTPNLTGRFLQGWGWDDFYWRNAGEYITEGLPNIWGQAYVHQDMIALGQGAFYTEGCDNARIGGGGKNDGNHNFYFNANRCTWIYGNSATVQPRAYVVYYIMKVLP